MESMLVFRCRALLFLASEALLVQILAAAQPSLPEILSRVAEEADVLQQNAVKTVTTERIEQRALLPPSRFKPRSGTAAAATPGSRFLIREIVSEYTVGSLREQSNGN